MKIIKQLHGGFHQMSVRYIIYIHLLFSSLLLMIISVFKILTHKISTNSYTHTHVFIAN